MANISQPVTAAFANVHLPTQIVKSCQEQGIPFDRKTQVPITDEIIKMISKKILFQEGYTSHLSFARKKMYPEERGPVGIELRIDILDQRGTPLRTITQLFHEKTTYSRTRFTSYIDPREDYYEPKDEFLDSYFRRPPVDRDFAKHHLPRALFNLCIEKGIEFDQPNQNRVDLPVVNRRHPFPIEKSLLVFKRVAKEREEEDSIELEMKLMDRNDEVIERASHGFFNRVWEGHFGLTRAAESFLDKYHRNADENERAAIMEAISENPQNHRDFYLYMRHFLRDRAQAMKETIETAYLGQKSSRIEAACSALFNKLPRQVQETLHYGHHRIQDLADSYPKLSLLFTLPL